MNIRSPFKVLIIFQHIKVNRNFSLVVAGVCIVKPSRFRRSQRSTKAHFHMLWTVYEIDRYEVKLNVNEK